MRIQNAQLHVVATDVGWLQPEVPQQLIIFTILIMSFTSITTATAAKKPFTKRSGPQLAWTEDQVDLLMHVVQVNRGHLADKKHNVGLIWEKIGNEFFGHTLMSDLKAIHHKPGTKCRKLRDKFNGVYEHCCKWIASGGNRSACNGDEMSPTYRIAKEMYDEKAKAIAVAAEKDTTRVHLNVLADSVLAARTSSASSMGSGKRKNLDGSTTGTKKVKTAVSLSPFEQKLLTILDQDGADSQGLVVEKEMNKWVNVFSKTTHDLVVEANLNFGNKNAEDILDDFGLEVLINIFCAPPDSFSSSAFKAALCKEGILSMDAHKLFVLMQKWRNEAHNFATNLSTEDDDDEEDEEATETTRAPTTDAIVEMNTSDSEDD